MKKILIKIMALFSFVEEATPWVVNTADQATKKLDKIVGETQANLQKVIDSKEKAQEELDEVIKAAQATYEAKEKEATKAVAKLDKLKDVFGD